MREREIEKKRERGGGGIERPKDSKPVKKIDRRIGRGPHHLLLL